MLTLRERTRLGATAGVVLAFLLLGPLLGSGYVLTRDMVFVPRLPLGGQLLGLDGVPRAVPSDLLVALGSRIVPAGWLQDLILLGIVVLGAWGAARCMPTTSRAGALVAATSYGWSPYLHERLLLGQWALLVGWAVLPWAAAAAVEWRRGESGWPAMAWLAVSATGGASALLVVALVVVVCGRPLRALSATAVLSLPWLGPALLQDLAPGDPRGVVAFAAHADTPFGVLGSLVTGGGVWAAAAVPPGRSVGAAVGLVLVAVAAVGVPRLRARVGDRLVLAGLLGLALALLGWLPITRDGLEWAVQHLPAAGLLRDGQKWLAPFVLLVALGLAGAAEVLARVRLLPVLLVLAPLAALPGAAWGEGGRLTTSTYPAEWEGLTRETHGAVMVLPWTLYRAFPWTGNRIVLDPATKLLSRPVVDDDLPLTTGEVQGEDPVAARLDGLATSGAPLLAALRTEGVSQVLVEKSARGYDQHTTERQVAGLTLVRETDELALYDVPDPGKAPDRLPVLPVLLGDLLAAGFGMQALRRAVRDRRP